MILDNRYTFRITPARFQSVPCPPAFLAKRPIVKVAAIDGIDGADGTPAEYYTAADGLTLEQACEKSGIPVVFYDESGEKPVEIELIEDADRVLFSLWNVYGSELAEFIAAVQSFGENPDEVIIPTQDLPAYLNNKTLPSEV